MNERRDLVMQYTSPSGHTVSMPKGGLVNASGRVSVPMIYQSRVQWGSFPGDCAVDDVKAWADSLLADLDADVEWQALMETLAEEEV